MTPSEATPTPRWVEVHATREVTFYIVLEPGEDADEAANELVDAAIDKFADVDNDDVSVFERTGPLPLREPVWIGGENGRWT